MRSSAPVRSRAAQDKPAAPASGATEQQDETVLAQAVDALATGGRPDDALIRWRGNHFIRSQGDSVYVPFTVVVDQDAVTGCSHAPSTSVP